MTSAQISRHNRNLNICRRRALGDTVKGIAEHYGLHRNAVMRILRRFEKDPAIVAGIEESRKRLERF